MKIVDVPLTPVGVALFTIGVIVKTGRLTKLFLSVISEITEIKDMVQLITLTLIRAPLARCFDLARSVEVHLQGNVHFGEQAMAEGGITSGLVGLGQSVTWRARHFGVSQRLTSEITAFEPPGYFQDTMRRGAFRSMQHDHYFRAISPYETEMRDVFRFSAPIPVFGRLAEWLVLTRYMRTLLTERNAVVKQVAESNEWRKYLKEEQI